MSCLNKDGMNNLPHYPFINQFYLKEKSVLRQLFSAVHRLSFLILITGVLPIFITETRNLHFIKILWPLLQTLNPGTLLGISGCNNPKNWRKMFSWLFRQTTRILWPLSPHRQETEPTVSHFPRTSWDRGRQGKVKMLQVRGEITQQLVAACCFSYSVVQSLTFSLTGYN